MKSLYTFLFLFIPFYYCAQNIDKSNESNVSAGKLEIDNDQSKDSIFIVENDGVHLGLSIIPSYGRLSEKNSFITIIEIDLDLYYSCTSGFRTGLRYLKSDIGYYPYHYLRDSIGDYYRVDGTIKGISQYIGIPAKFIYNTKKKVGFYVEGGVVIYILNYVEAMRSFPELNENQEIERRGFNLTWDIEAALGLNIRFDDRMKLKFGTNLALTPIGNKENIEYFIGLQVGFSYKISKQILE